MAHTLGFANAALAAPAAPTSRPGCSKRPWRAGARGSFACSATAAGSTDGAPVVAASGVSRRAMLTRAVSAAAAAALLARPCFAPASSHAADSDDAPLPGGIAKQVVSRGKGQVSPRTGDLVAVRFRGTYNDIVFDDILEQQEPFYFRIGNGTVLRGIEEAVRRMRSGDRWRLTIPGEYAFGKQGRRPSPGKPPIPPNATVLYEVELVEVPGREAELLEVTGGGE